LFAELESALNESAKALAQAAEQKETDRAAMSEAISAFCQIFGLDDVPSGSSPQSRLWALGGHMRGRLREALHHGVRRAFAVLASHYDVDLERVNEGYCLPDEDEAALAEVQRTRPPRAQARCWRPPSRWKSFRLRRRPRPGRVSPRVETTLRVETKPRVQLLPRAMPDSAGAVCFEHVCVFRGCRGLNTLSSCYKAMFLFLPFRVSGLVRQ
jgi:hypothetical protein